MNSVGAIIPEVLSEGIKHPNFSSENITLDALLRIDEDPFGGRTA